MRFVLAVLALFSVTSAVPFSGTNTAAQRLLNSKRDDDGMIIIGDMRMSESQILEYYGTPKERALGEERIRFRWPNAVIPYAIDPSLGSAKHLGMIKQAMDFWEAETCIKFEKITSPSTPHIYLISGKRGCNSMVGLIVGRNACCKGNQTVNLEMPGCEQVNTICHELGHAIGLQHEMSRPDRDDYLNVFLNNSNKLNWNNYEKLTKYVIADVVPYDFTSTMHYWITGNSNKANYLVVTPKDPAVTPFIDRSIRPSFYDYVLVNHMYDCQKGCNVQCMNGGFATRSTAKGCHCLCPYDTTGDKCENKVQVDTCSKIIQEEGSLRPPNRNDPYDEFPKCSFIIKAPAGKKVSLQFRSMNLDCKQKEKIMLRNSDLTGDKIYSNYCQKFSNLRTPPIISEGNEMQLILFNKVSEDAFEADITFV